MTTAPPELLLSDGLVACYLDERPLAEAVNGPMIRLWCEMVEDANPLYHDPAFARSQGFRDIVAPPPMLLAWTFEPTWTPMAGRARTMSRDMPEVPGRPHACVLQMTQTYHRPLEAGERPTMRYYRHLGTEETETHRGRGVVLSNVMSLHDEHGAEIVRQSSHILRFRTGDSPSAAFDSVGADGPISQPPDTVGPGTDLPPLEFPVPRTRFMIAVSATRDFYQVHHDRTFARATGVADMYIGTHFMQGLIGRYITDHVGAGSVLCSLALLPYERNHPDDVIIVRGRIVGERPTAAGPVLDIAVRCSNARVVTHDATVTVRRARQLAR